MRNTGKYVVAQIRRCCSFAALAKKIILERCWIVGVVLISADGFLSSGRISAQRADFQSLNLVGSLMLAANSARHDAWLSASVNLIGNQEYLKECSCFAKTEMI